MYIHICVCMCVCICIYIRKLTIQIISMFVWKISAKSWLVVVSHLIYSIRYGWQWHIKYIHSFQQYISSFTRHHILLSRVHITDMMSLSSITYSLYRYVCMHIYINIYIYDHLYYMDLSCRHQITDKSTACSTACKGQNKMTHQISALFAFWMKSIGRFTSQRHFYIMTSCFAGVPLGRHVLRAWLVGKSLQGFHWKVHNEKSRFCWSEKCHNGHQVGIIGGHS